MPLGDKMIEFDGAEIVKWFSRATDVELALLENSEYSDSDDIWTVKSTKPTGLVVVKDGQFQQVLRPYGFFRSGAFFLDDEIGCQIRQKINDTLSQNDKNIVEANMYLGARGFFVSELGGDSHALLLAKAIRNFDQKGKIPDDDDWERIYELLTNCKAAVMKCGAKFISEWIIHSEKQNEGLFDVYRRVLLAVLYRHSGLLEKALEASDIVDLPRSRLRGNNSTMSVLCTTRAATLMDIAEMQPRRRTELLHTARLTLNKANAMSNEDSEEIMAAYKRLKSSIAMYSFAKESEIYYIGSDRDFL